MHVVAAHQSITSDDRVISSSNIIKLSLELSIVAGVRRSQNDGATRMSKKF